MLAANYDAAAQHYAATLEASDAARDAALAAREALALHDSRGLRRRFTAIATFLLKPGNNPIASMVSAELLCETLKGG